MASIRKRRRAKRDVWLVDFNDARGRRRRLTASTKEEAQLLLAEKLREADEMPRLVGDPDTTLEQYAAQVLARLEPTIKPSTLASYRYLYRVHLAPALGDMRIRDLRRIHVKTLLQEKREQELSKNTVRLIRSCLSVILAEAKEDELIDDNAAAVPTRRRGQKGGNGTVSAAERQKALRPFSEAELNHLLDRAERHDPDYFPIILLLARTGARPGEAAALMWSDFDFTNRKILIERACSAGTIGTTKTDGVRIVDMSSELRAALTALYKKREAQTLARGWGEVPELVFVTTARGRPLDLGVLRKRFAKIMKLAGISGHRLYDLRHSVATHLLAAGVPLTYVSHQLGHARPSTTLQWYARWLPQKDAGSFIDLLDRDGTNLAPVASPAAERDEKTSLSRGNFGESPCGGKVGSADAASGGARRSAFDSLSDAADIGHGAVRLLPLPRSGSDVSCILP
jgi:integrase